MDKIKRILGYLLLPLTVVGLFIKFFMNSNVDGAKEDIENAESFEDKKQAEINLLKKKESEAKIKEERMKAKLEVIAESKDTDWYKD